MQCKITQDCDRDTLIRIFIPENEEFINAADDEDMDVFIKRIFDNGNIFKMRSAGNEPDNKDWVPKTYVYLKKVERDEVSFRYKRIFDLCRVIGVHHIYDIGCCYLNQSFYLSDYTRMTYTGIDCNNFILNDYRKKDYINENIYYPCTETAPSPFCDNRIRFLKAKYPFKIDTPADNIAVSAYSITNTTDPNEIKALSEAFIRDFDRVLFNTSRDSVNFWKKYTDGYFEFYPIGHNRFVFGTKRNEDIRRMKEMYPFENGNFFTGIDNYWSYDSMESYNPEVKSGYIVW